MTRSIGLNYSRLSSTLWCGGHPARGPTSGSEAYLKSVSASLSRHGRSRILAVCIMFLFFTAKISIPFPFHSSQNNKKTNNFVRFIGSRIIMITPAWFP